MRGGGAPRIDDGLPGEKAVWRPIVVVLLLTLLIGGALRSHDPAVVAPVPVDPPAAVAYGELRAVPAEDPGSLEMVGVLEFPSLAQCRHPRAQDVFREMCGEIKLRCVTETLVCREDVAPRYRRMLEGQPVALHYARIVYRLKHSSSRPRMVIAGWGNTVDDSLTACRMMIEDWPAERGDAQCI